jgi:hypothetical protein
MKAAVELEIYNAIGRVQTVGIGEIIQKVIDVTVEDCAKAAFDGFERAMDDYVLIGPSGMAMQMVNSVKALKHSPDDVSAAGESK